MENEQTTSAELSKKLPLKVTNEAASMRSPMANSPIVDYALVRERIVERPGYPYTWVKNLYGSNTSKEKENFKKSILDLLLCFQAYGLNFNTSLTPPDLGKVHRHRLIYLYHIIQEILINKKKQPEKLLSAYTRKTYQDASVVGLM